MPASGAIDPNLVILLLATCGAKSVIEYESMALQKSITDHTGMLLISTGTFWMGSEDQSFIDVRPVHRVRIDRFWIDKTEVTNKEFARFVKDTGYKTVAERKPLAKDFPGAPPENLVAGSLVFIPPDHEVSAAVTTTGGITSLGRTGSIRKDRRVT